MTDTGDLSGGDVRTLQYASVAVDDALLEALVRWQRAMLDALGPGWDADALARAHAKALAASGLSAERIDRPLAVLRRFAGNRRTAARLRDAAARIGADRREDLEGRLRQLDAELRARDDGPTVERLLAREAELLDLTGRLDALLRG